MNNSGKQQSFSDREVDDRQQSTDDSSPVSNDTSGVSSAPVSGDCTTRRNGNDIGLAARLTDLFVGDGDGDSDLLMQRNTQDGTVVQWLHALDMQVMGACRADERLKPLLKLNVSSVAEDRLLSHLSQHFEPSEVGLLARCLCIPLVSVRVGKINKQGTLLIPTSARGNLVLSFLPTSDMRISFLADDGYAERLSILRNRLDCSSVVIEGIPADSSGRSFAIRIPCRDPFYFWCSEKSRLLGNELLEKMKNLLEMKPSLAELTGISDSRLERFVDHLRTYLAGSIGVDNITLVSAAAEVGQNPQSPSLASKASRGRSVQGSLSPRPSSFKEGLPRNFRNVVRDKLRRIRLSTDDSSEKQHPSPSTCEPNSCDKGKLPESSPGTCLSPWLGPEKTVDDLLPSLSSAPQIASSLFSPYYCWCPPVVSTLQYTVAPPHMIPGASTAESFTLPPLSSLLAGSGSGSGSMSMSGAGAGSGSGSGSSSGFLTPKPTPNLSEMPPFLPEPLVCLPLSSQQIPMFTPLMCDPIVHVPVIDISSSGQAYLVSASPAMSVSIPPLVQETESEKSARDTLRLLISGSPSSVVANPDGGSRGFYGGTTDVSAIANSIAAMGLVPPGVMRRCIDKGDLVDLLEDAGGDEDGSGKGGGSTE